MDLLELYARYVATDPEPDVARFLEDHPEATEFDRDQVRRYDHDRRRAADQAVGPTEHRRGPTGPAHDWGITTKGTVAGRPPVEGPDYSTLSLERHQTSATGMPGAGAPLNFTEPGPPSLTAPDTPSERHGLATRADSVRLIQRDERFVVRRLLGTGGMGVVYEAFDRKRSEVVALKMMKDVGPTALYQFKQEFRALADLSHPNLLSLHELIPMGDRLSFTMELIEGEDFLTYVRGDFLEGPADTESSLQRTATVVAAMPGPALGPNTGGPSGLDARQVARLRAVLAQLVAGINALHRAGTLHRDIKPSNVLVTRGGRVVVLDFGLVVETGHGGGGLEHDSAIVGTVAYMAPEQAAGKPLGPAGDWYSVGVMLHEALTGVRPIEGGPLDVLQRKQTHVVPPPSRLVEGIPADLDDLCGRLLSIDPAARPSGDEILHLLAPVRPGPTPFEQRGAATVPLIGRSTHREVLERAYDRAREARRAVMVGAHGRSGIGKSALVQAFLEDLSNRDPNVVILTGRCYERESVPYKALDSLVDALARYLARLPEPEAAAVLPREVHALARVFPVLRRVEAVAAAPGWSAQPLDPQELRRRAFGALRSLLKRLGATRPLVLAIDDLQWGDVDSAALLAELLRPPNAPQMLLIGSYRSEDLATSPFLEKLREMRRGDRPMDDFIELHVEPLTVSETRDLARSLLNDQASEEALLAIARESGGNPFFVQELVQHALQGTSASEGGAVGRIDLDRVLWARMQSLPVATRALLEVIATSGRPIHQADALAAVDLAGADGRVLLKALRTGRLIRFRGREDAEEVETYHDRIREAVLLHLDEPILARHHGRLATALEASGRAGPEILALHYLGSNDHQRAALHFNSAADLAVEALAFDHAAALYDQVLRLGPPPDRSEERRLRARLADALANAGRCVEAARQYQIASEGAPHDELLELRRRATLHFLTSGHLNEGFKSLADVLKRVKLHFPSTPRQALLSLLVSRLRMRWRGLRLQLRHADAVPRDQLTRIDICWSGGVGLGVIDTVRAAEFQARGLLLALDAGEPHRLVRSLAVEAAFEATSSGPSRRRVPALLRAADDLAKLIDDSYAHGMVAFGSGLATYMEANWKRCLGFMDRAEALFRDRCTSVTWELDTTHVFALWSLKYLGELRELQRRWPILLNEARERGDRYAITNLSTYLMATARLAADQPGLALEELARVERLWDYPGFHLQHHGTIQGMAYCALYQGDPGRAWDTVRAAWPRYRASFLIRLQKVRIDILNLRANSALAAANAGHREASRLRRDAAWCADRLEREGLPWSDALSVLVRASLAASEGRTAAAIAGFEQAAARFESREMKVAAAVARRRRGELLAGDEGKRLVDEADRLLRDEQVLRPDLMALVHAPPCHAAPAGRRA